MERIKPKGAILTSPPAWQVQSDVSAYEPGKQFKSRDLKHHKSSSPSGTLGKMNCVSRSDEKAGAGFVFERTGDPRLEMTDFGTYGVFPICMGCHFTRSDTVGCIIFDAAAEVTVAADKASNTEGE